MMLALTRKCGQTIVVDDNIVITVVSIKGEQVRLAVSAPSDKKIYRGEIYESILNENKTAAQPVSIIDLDSLLKNQFRSMGKKESE